MKRTTVMLYTEEHEALLQLAERERRDPRAQAAFLIRRGLEQSGVLSSPKRLTQIAAQRSRTVADPQVTTTPLAPQTRPGRQSPTEGG